MQYTTDMPYEESARNLRYGYRLPRKILLPPYLVTNPYFVEYTEGIDFVFDNLEEQLEGLKNIRNMWVTTPATEAKIDAGEMLNFEDWGGPDRATVIKQVNLLGMRLSNAGLIDERGYRAIAKMVGSYWFEKGKATSIDFLNFCLGTQFDIEPLWTRDYDEFVPKSMAGATIFDTPPGEWYPTTHVSITVPGEYQVDPNTIVSFFYEVANYNLVVRIVINYYDVNISSLDSEDTANVIQMAINTEHRYDLFSLCYPLLAHSVVGGGMGNPLIGITLEGSECRPRQTFHATVGGHTGGSNNPLTFDL